MVCQSQILTFWLWSYLKDLTGYVWLVKCAGDSWVGALMRLRVCQVEKVKSWTPYKLV